MTLLCAVTLMLNVSGSSINKQDLRAFSGASNTCATNARYEGLRCLKKFIKREQGVYWAICGEKVGYDKKNETFSEDMVNILRL